MRHLLLIFIVVLSACSANAQKQGVNALNKAFEPVFEASEKEAMKRYIQSRVALHTVHSRIMTLNVDLCNAQRRDMGVIFHQLSDYPKSFQTIANALYGAEKHPRIMKINQANIAEGFRAGDVLLDSKDTPVLDYKIDVQRTLEAGFVRVDRDGRDLILPVQAPKICAYRPRLSLKKTMNATAKNGNIEVTLSLLNALQNEDELAFILSHELAHYLLRHVVPVNEEKPLTHPEKHTRELDADYVGLYLMARAGYDPYEIDSLWGGIEKRQFLSLSFFSDYPNLKERRALMLEAVTEIGLKKRAGGPLIPFIKGVYEPKVSLTSAKGTL